MWNYDISIEHLNMIAKLEAVMWEWHMTKTCTTWSICSVWLLGWRSGEEMAFWYLIVSVISLLNCHTLPGAGTVLLRSAGIIRYYLQEVERRRQQWTSCHKQTQVSCEDREHYEHLRQVLISFWFHKEDVEEQQPLVWCGKWLISRAWNESSRRFHSNAP